VTGIPVVLVDKLKYLGIILDNCVSFTDHIREVSKKAMWMIGAFGSVLRKWHIKAQTEQIYLCCIQPILTYGMAVTFRKSKQGISIIERAKCTDMEDATILLKL
jgi:hypothetical protein